VLSAASKFWGATPAQPNFFNRPRAGCCCAIDQPHRTAMTIPRPPS
jgi:hypothetical protein